MKTFLSFYNRNGIPYEQPPSHLTTCNIDQFAYMVQNMASLKKGSATLLENCIMIWSSGLEDRNKHQRENLPFIIAGKGGGSVNTGKFLPDIRGS